MVIADDIGGRRNKNSIMRVLPFQSQSMEQKGPDVQLPPKKNGCSRGWLSFICFGHTPAEFECPSPPKVGPLPQYVPLKSSLKKPTVGSVLVGGGNDGCIIRKKVRWPDYCGKELIEIKHFQCQVVMCVDYPFMIRIHLLICLRGCVKFHEATPHMHHGQSRS